MNATRMGTSQMRWRTSSAAKAVPLGWLARTGDLLKVFEGLPRSVHVRGQCRACGAAVLTYPIPFFPIETREMNHAAVVFEHVSLAFGDHEVLRDINFSVARGSMMILLGASGAGKSVILKLILGLLRPDTGVIYVNGERIDNMSETELLRIRADIGMLF